MFGLFRLILFTISILIVMPVFARTKVASGKHAAPDIEDHASYFRKKNSNISEADRRRADQLRIKSISSIREMISKNKRRENRFELMLRLGELHIERHDFLRDLAMDQYARDWERWSTNKDSKNNTVEPKVDLSAAEKELENAASSFRQLVNEFPKHRRSDAAIYALAQASARLGHESAVGYYKKLISLHPKSSLVADSYLSLGEYYFDKHNIVEAIENYKKVLAFKDHRAYPYAVYKLGWAYFNAPQGTQSEAQENYKKSVAAFKLVVSLASKKKQKDQSGTNYDLRDEALRDLVMVWADSEDVSAAWSYFRSIGEQESFYKVLERLGNIYADQGKNEKAIAVFQRLLKEAPKRDRNPWVHAKLVEILDNMNKVGDAVAELKAMPSLYVGDTKWTIANKKQNDSSLIDQARDLVQNNLHRFGTMFHQRGQKSKSDLYLEAAASVYEVFLNKFPKAKASYELRYYLAEIQYDSKKYEEASKNYIIVVQQDQTGKFYKSSAINSVTALHAKIASEKFPKTPPLGRAQDPIPIPPIKKLLVQAMDLYLKILPNEKESNNMRFEAAQIYFEYGYYPEALKRFGSIIDSYPQSKQAETSAKIILAYYTSRQDWQNVINLGQIYSDKKEFSKNIGLQKFVAETVREATFSLASSHEKANKFELAASTFLRYQKQFPQDNSADRALYNAMNNYFKVGKTESALTVGRALIKSYPKSVLLPDVLADIASTYESVANFSDAAQIYRRLGSEFAKDKRAPTALYNSAILFRGLKQFDDAIVSLKTFLANFPNHDLASDVYVELAGLYERQGDALQAIQTYEAMNKNFPSRRDLVSLAFAKVAVLRTSNMKPREAQAALDRVRPIIAKADPEVSFQARDVLAAALFKSIDDIFSDFISLRVSDGKNIEKSIEEKQKKLVYLSDLYEQIVDLGSGEYIVASLYRLGEAHENFAQNLVRIVPPREISQADKDKFKTELEKLAFPLKEQAYNFFETALKRSAEIKTFSEWTRRSYKKMSDLDPEKNRPLDDLTAEPSYLLHAVYDKDGPSDKMTKNSFGGEL